MKSIEVKPAMTIEPTEVTELPAVYCWRHQDREIVLGNPDIVLKEDGTMAIAYVTVIDAVVVNYRVWRQLGVNNPLWHATDITGALHSTGVTAPQALMRLFL